MFNKRCKLCSQSQLFIVPPAPVRMSATSTAKVPTMWPPSYHKQGSNRSKGHILHLGPLMRKSRRGHKVSPVERPASSSLVVTPVPFALTGDMFFKEASLLGNASFLLKHVSSVNQSAAVANVRDAPAVVTGILDLSALKRFLQIKTFKMETPESIRLSLQQGEWVTSLDFRAPSGDQLAWRSFGRSTEPIRPSRGRGRGGFCGSKPSCCVNKFK